jgi:hypothetical protein
LRRLSTLAIISGDARVATIGEHEMNSEFDKRLSKKPKHKNAQRATDAKAWRYVGRFMQSFAAIEGAVDRLILELFPLEPIAYFLLISNLDLKNADIR